MLSDKNLFYGIPTMMNLSPHSIACGPWTESVARKSPSGSLDTNTWALYTAFSCCNKLQHRNLSIKSVCVCVCVCMYVCVHTCVCGRWVCFSAWVWACTCMFTCMHVHLSVYMYTSDDCVCVCVCVCMCMCTCYHQSKPYNVYGKRTSVNSVIYY